MYCCADVISRDPVGFEAGDTNLYRYVGNSPTNGIDPTGTTADTDGTSGTAVGTTARIASGSTAVPSGGWSVGGLGGGIWRGPKLGGTTQGGAGADQAQVRELFS
ncbi:MAG: hypothetical protein HY290_11020, partial [Planctomycetia bacterium]|nr:hypothetical protein [Planctomycetia bacterium]